MRLIFTIFQMESCSHKREFVKKTSCGNNCSFRECDNNRNDLHKTEIGKSSLLLNSCYSLVGVALIWNKRSIYLIFLISNKSANSIQTSFVSVLMKQKTWDDLFESNCVKNWLLERTLYDFYHHNQKYLSYGHCDNNNNFAMRSFSFGQS